MKLILLFLSTLLTLAVAKPDPFVAKVMGVHDGDTITVYAGEGPQIKIRLAGIDAPELKQAYGAESKAALAALVFGKEIRLVPKSKDRYRRTIADIYLADRWINLEMVQIGAARHYLKYSKSKALKAAQAQAAAAPLGL